MDMFGFGRGPPRWAWQPLKVLLFFKKCWRCITLEDHISRSTWPIWAKVCLLERSNSLLLIKNMNNRIYRLFPILGRGQCLVRYIFRGTSGPTGSLQGLKPPTIILYKTTLKNLDTFRVFVKRKFLFHFEPSKFLIFWTLANYHNFCWSKWSKIWL